MLRKTAVIALISAIALGFMLMAGAGLFAGDGNENKPDKENKDNKGDKGDKDDENES